MNKNTYREPDITAAVKLYAKALKTDQDEVIYRMGWNIYKDFALTNMAKLMMATKSIRESNFSKRFKNKLLAGALLLFELAEAADSTKVVTDWTQTQLAITSIHRKIMSLKLSKRALKIIQQKTEEGTGHSIPIAS